MNELASAIFLVLAGLVILQVLFTAAFVSSLRCKRQSSLQDDQLPRAAVILCLRGADPFLPDCLRRLLNQNYPRYELRIIVDSREDPAWEIVAQTLRNQAATNVQISPLIVRRETCSLKCSALVQAVSELDDSYEVIALVDADTVSHRDWLRELVSPLADSRVGATTGNRWYMPVGGYWGSLIRYLWNVAAVLQMYIYDIPWAGSLAMKTELIHQTQLLEKWGQTFNDDVILHCVLREQGLKLKFVPSLMMVNREECDLPSARSWVKRQLLNARLYHPWWWAIVGYGILTTLIPALAGVLLLAALLTGQWYSVAWAGGGLATYMVALVLLLGILEQGVRKVVQARGEPMTEFSVITVAKILIAIPLTQLVYAVAMVSAMFVRNVEWRGITYQIKGPWNIRLVKYHPYQPSGQLAETKASL